jgi:hypothetical protein
MCGPQRACETAGDANVNVTGPNHLFCLHPGLSTANPCEQHTDFGIADLRTININSAAIQFLELVLAPPRGEFGVDSECNKDAH